MIIGIKATQIGPGGGLTHLVQCLRWFGELAPNDKFIVYGHTGQAKLFCKPPTNIGFKLYSLPSHGLLSRLYWERTRLPEIVAQDRCDILLEPGNYATPGISCPSVTLVHNLAPFVSEYVRTESLYQQLRLKLLKRLTLLAINQSAGTIFLSQYARRCISPFVSSTVKPIAVIYHGASERMNTEEAGPLATLPDTEGCILCVSHIYRYKGILELVKGYAKELSTDQSLPDLVIAGALYDKAYIARIRQFLAQARIEHRVRLIGEVAQTQLTQLYSRCRFFVFPSTIENCPNILLEALASKCAIACSDAGVMPEICADAAVYFDPSDMESISARILVLHQDDRLRKTLSERAAKRGAEFSWRETAQQTLDFLREVKSVMEPSAKSPATRTPVPQSH